MYKKYLHIGFLFFVTFFFAQVKEDVYYFIDKAIAKTYQNPEGSIDFVQNLLVNEKGNNQLIYHNVLAQSYAMMGDYQKAVQSILNLEELNHENLSPFESMYLGYCISDQYQNLGLYEQSDKILKKIIQSNDLSENPESQITLAKVYQLSAINDLVLKNEKNAKSDLVRSNELLTGKNQENEILKIENQLYLGVSYAIENKVSSAEKEFSKALQNPEITKYPFLEAMAKRYLAHVLFLQQLPQESIDLLLDALKILENTNYLPMKSAIYQNLSKAYLAQKNDVQYHFYRKLYENSKVELDENQKAATSFLVNAVERVSQKDLLSYKKEKSRNTLYFGIFSLAIVSIVLIFFILASRKELELDKQLEFFRDFQENQKRKIVQKQEEKPKETPISKEDQRKSTLLSPEKEEELITKLDAFENSELFLSNQMSLPFLAAELETNIKYLSEIIRNHKGKKFNAYINGLRIQHIIHLLKTNPTYLNYKVSYLAEMSGFSSHSAFTAVFKSITGMSPNDFIQQINQQKGKSK